MNTATQININIGIMTTVSTSLLSQDHNMPLKSWMLHFISKLKPLWTWYGSIIYFQGLPFSGFLPEDKVSGLLGNTEALQKILRKIYLYQLIIECKFHKLLTICCGVCLQQTGSSVKGAVSGHQGQSTSLIQNREKAWY